MGQAICVVDFVRDVRFRLDGRRPQIEHPCRFARLGLCGLVPAGRFQAEMNPRRG